MAEPLKNSFGPEVPRTLARMIAAVAPDFEADQFVAVSLDGYDALELTPRAWQVARALRPFLPENTERALALLEEALGPELVDDRLEGMAGFLYLPLVFFVGEFGVPHFEASMRLQHALTRRFTAEFSIRAFLEAHPERTLARLREWALEPNLHVRRLVSEGTRPRLPWAPRLRRFQEDPEPVLELLELLKDDPELYVRRSVANNLNDIAKDHPDRVVELCRRWMRGANTNRRALVRHALRSLVKEGHPEALAVLGFGERSMVHTEVVLEPRRAVIGGKIRAELRIRNPGSEPQAVAVDLRVHFVKADGRVRPKVFKGAELQMEPGEERVVRRSISLAQHTTRRHYPGAHRLELLVNGEVRPGGTFDVVAPE